VGGSARPLVRRSLRTSVLGAVAATAGLAAAVGVIPPASAAGSPASRGLTAVLSVRPGTPLPLRAPGVRVLDVLSRVDAEVVRGPAAALERLRALPAVAGLEADTTGKVAANGWATTTTGVYAPTTIGGAAGQRGAGAGVTVALLDTGVDDTAALNRASGRLVDGIDVSGLSAGQPARTSGTFTDGYGHGTFLASLIAGGPTPGSGGQAVGVAPAATVDVVKVADDDGSTSLWQVLAGLDWVAVHHRSINVVNLSLAVPRATFPAYGADPLTTAVQLLRNAGVTVVAASGNTPGQVGDPGMAPEALTVGSADLTSGGGVASFSGSGVVDGVAKPDLVASGVGVLGAMAPDTAIARANPFAWQPSGLFRGSGTSMSTAITAGAAAVLLGQHPGLPPVAVKSALRLAARPVNDARAGAGLLSLDGSTGGWRGHAGQQPTGRDGWGGDRCGSAQSDPTGEGCFDAAAWWRQAWLGGAWIPWLASSWSASSWSASSWSASSWSASSWSASSWSASSWSASSWSAAFWGDGP
jgi:serine protease AprX